MRAKRLMHLVASYPRSFCNSLSWLQPAEILREVSVGSFHGPGTLSYHVLLHAYFQDSVGD